MYHSGYIRLFIFLSILLNYSFSLNEVEKSLKFANVTKIMRLKREIVGTRKYLIFPEGSNVQVCIFKIIFFSFNIFFFLFNKIFFFQFVYCLTIASLARPHGFFTLGVTSGIAYELPYKSIIPFWKPSNFYHRRSRRDLYNKIEQFFQT